MEFAAGNGALSLLGVRILVDCEWVNEGFVLLPYHGLKIVLDFVSILMLMVSNLVLVLVVLRFVLALAPVPLSMVKSLALALVLSPNLELFLNLFFAVVESVLAAVPDRQSQPPLFHRGAPHSLELSCLSQFHP